MPSNRPSFTKAKQEDFLGHIRAGMRRGAAAETLKLSRETVRRYIEDHPDFEKRVLDAELDANEHVEEALYQAAVSGNVGACRAWMELRGGGPRVVRKPADPPEADGDEFDELDNVTAIDPRRRK